MRGNGATPYNEAAFSRNLQTNRQKHLYPPKQKSSPIDKGEDAVFHPRENDAEDYTANPFPRGRALTS
jgi:hypothetical protein